MQGINDNNHLVNNNGKPENSKEECQLESMTLLL